MSARRHGHAGPLSIDAAGREAGNDVGSTASTTVDGAEAARGPAQGLPRYVAYFGGEAVPGDGMTAGDSLGPQGTPVSR